jgi:hypothetical protein
MFGGAGCQQKMADSGLVKTKVMTDLYKKKMNLFVCNAK